MMDDSVRRNESAVTPSDNSKIRHDSRASFVKDNSQNSSAQKRKLNINIVTGGVEK